MPKAVGEPRLGSKTKVSAFTTETGMSEWKKNKEKLETRKKAWNRPSTWR